MLMDKTEQLLYYNELTMYYNNISRLFWRWQAFGSRGKKKTFLSTLEQLKEFNHDIAGKRLEF